MPTSIMRILFNLEFYLSGAPQAAGEGPPSAGRMHRNSRVHIVRVLDNGSEYLVLLCDQHNNMLGWTNFNNLTAVATVNITSMGVA